MPPATHIRLSGIPQDTLLKAAGWIITALLGMVVGGVTAWASYVHAELARSEALINSAEAHQQHIEQELAVVDAKLELLLGYLGLAYSGPALQKHEPASPIASDIQRAR